MTIQEAINHAKEVAERNRKQYKNCPAERQDIEHQTCEMCAQQHEQLAKWLEEIQQYRAIGTVEECREAMERRIARKPEKELRDLENNPEIDCYGINELNNACARAADAIEALSAKMQAVNMETCSRWIAVEKRLPENSQNVLAGFKNDCEYVIAYYSEMNKKWTNSSTGWEITADVIAWQPLPEPYRSKSEEGDAYE